jgi:hypothetical protein
MFNIGDLVEVKDKGLGTVQEIVDSSIADLKVYIVQLRETKDLLKCLEEDLSLVKEITITKEDFVNAIKNINMDPLLDPLGNPLIAMMFGNVLGDFCIALYMELFEKKAEND